MRGLVISVKPFHFSLDGRLINEHSRVILVFLLCLGRYKVSNWDEVTVHLTGNVLFRYIVP